MMKKIAWLQNKMIKAGFCADKGAMVTLKAPSDPQQTEFLLMPGEFPEFDGEDAGWLGNLNLEIVRGDETLLMRTAASGDIRTCGSDKSHFRVEYRGDSSQKQGIRSLHISENFSLQQNGIRWDIQIRNLDEEQIIIKKLGIPLLMNQYFRGDDAFKYEQCVMRHSCIVGTHSWCYWSKSSGDQPVLLLQTLGATGLYHFERCADETNPIGCRATIGKAFEGLFQVYPYHTPTQESQLDCSEKILEAGDTVILSFLFSMESDTSRIGGKLAENGGIGVEVSPGMCVPKGQAVRMRLQTGNIINIRTEHEEDQLLYLKPVDAGYEAELVLEGYGIRKIEVQSADGIMVLSFFGLEEPEKIIDRQAAFIAEKQLETNQEDPCYHGLLMWDMTLGQRINSTCNPYGPDWFAGGSDEIGLVSGVFLSEKNVYRPKESEIRVLSMYLKDFVEERLTEQPGDKVHRMVPWFQMFDDWKGRGADDVWRAFNYVHVINTYYNMYRIRSIYRYEYMEDTGYYLKRACDYTKAMFRYWMFPDGVGATQYANMGEMTIPLELPRALRKEGMTREAADIQAITEKKGKYFASKDYPFGSEMAYDSTAFEAVYAYGRQIDDERIMLSAVKAALANRGSQPIWYLHRTDLRQMGDSNWNVSYMTQLGAYGFYDWALEQNHKDTELIKALYASYLAGFAIYNSGGFWSDKPENEGASAWIIVGEKGRFSGADEEGRPCLKGCVPMSGESALGYFGALRIAASVMLQEEDGKLLGLGCRIRQKEDNIWVTPCDGLQMRWFDMAHDWAVKLSRDSIREIMWSQKEYKVMIENYTGDRHELSMMLRMPQAGKYQICTEDDKQEIWLGTQWNELMVPVGESGCAVSITVIENTTGSGGFCRTHYEG